MKTVISVIQRFLKSKGRDYVAHNIQYANANANRSYAGFLGKCLEENWGEWSPTIDDETRKRLLEQAAKLAGFESVAELFATKKPKQILRNTPGISEQTIRSLLG